VIVAACSYHHSFILCADGALFSCGRNDSGQLGHGDTVDKKTPQSVLNCPKGIISISCGQFHTLAATTSGVAYVCGKNDYGQLGMEVNGNVKVFSEITNHPEIDQVVQVCCGYYHSLLLSNTGVVVGFGRNDYGQVSFNHRYRYNSSPYLIIMNSIIKYASMYAI
jgi:RCC1 and BTB domain-containing protein